MEKINYYLISYKNIQELIKFIDQKIAAVIIVNGIEIKIFYDLTKNLNINLFSKSIGSIFTFIIGLIFLGLVFSILYVSIFKILKPRYAENYNQNQYSSFYFEHISNNTKEQLFENVDNLNNNIQLKEISDQLYEISGILLAKTKNCSIVMKLLFISILTLFIFGFITKFII